MILGRSTVQWVSLFTAGGALAQVVIVNTVPDIDATLVATLIGAVITFLSTFVAFLANTSTTPSGDPQLKAGTMIRVTNDAGTMIGHTPVPTPDAPPSATDHQVAG